MTQLQWREAKGAPAPRMSKASPSSSTDSPWFGVAVGLAGIIVGYMIGMS